MQISFKLSQDALILKALFFHYLLHLFALSIFNIVCYFVIYNKLIKKFPFLFFYYSKNKLKYIIKLIHIIDMMANRKKSVH